MKSYIPTKTIKLLVPLVVKDKTKYKQYKEKLRQAWTKYRSEVENGKMQAYSKVIDVYRLVANELKIPDELRENNVGKSQLIEILNELLKLSKAFMDRDKLAKGQGDELKPGMKLVYYGTIVTVKRLLPNSKVTIINENGTLVAVAVKNLKPYKKPAR